MDFFKAQFNRITAQLNGLSASQKMLTFCLAAITVMTLIWWSYWAATPEMQPLLNQSMSQDDIGVIAANLDAKGIPHEVVGDKVMVPADRKLEVLAELGYSQALPRDFKTGFDDIVKQINWLDSPDKTDRMYLEAKQRTLAMVICQFPNVSNAIVVIDPTSERNFSGDEVQPSAAVNITTRGGHENIKQLAESAANVVSGAEAGLLRSRINIVIDGAAYNVPDNGPDSLPGDSIVDAQSENEDHYRDKIRSLFGDINGLMVSVTCSMDTKYTETRSHKVDPKSTVALPTKTDEQTDESSSPGPGSPEAGAVPNVGVAITGGGGGGGNTSNSSDEKTEMMADFSKEDTFSKQGPGEATVVAASVRVPRSYFVQEYKTQNDGKDPDDAALSTFMGTELDQIRKDVKACTGLTSDDAVVVDAYSDVAPPTTDSQAPSSAPVALMLGSHSKEIAVGVWAVVSLFMVLMMSRGGAPAPVVVVPAETKGPSKLEVGETLAGEVGEGGAMLDGIEVDEESVKTQQMIEQVQEMVKQNPDAAANLVKRWMSHA
jgi:flagellar M-ring protein FliF